MNCFLGTCNTTRVRLLQVTPTACYIGSDTTESENPVKQQTLQEAWDDYTTHSRSMMRAEGTLKNRAWIVAPFLRDYGHKKLASITEQHVAEFFIRVSDKRSTTTLSSTHAVLAAFYGFCVKTGRLKPQQNVMLVRERPKPDRNVDRQRIPVHEWPRLMGLAEANDARDRAVVAVGLYTLLRDQEMAQLRIRDVNMGAGHVAAVVPKTKDFDLVPITEDLDYELRRWYQHYQTVVGELRPDMLLLPKIRVAQVRGNGRWQGGGDVTYVPDETFGKSSRFLTPLYGQMGYKIRDENGKSLNLGAHTLRRSGARAYYDHFVAAGRADALRVVQTMLHHSTAEMTQHYIGLREDRQTRDQLLRGVTIFGLHNMPSVGSGPFTSANPAANLGGTYGDPENIRQAM